MTTLSDQRTLQTQAWTALDQSLGRVDAARFFRQHGRPDADAALQEKGMSLLRAVFGAEDANRFFRDFEIGDYTAERHLWLDGMTQEELMARVINRREAQAGAVA